MKDLLIKRSFIFIFFLALMLIGLSIFKDYGVHFDNYNAQSFGNDNLRFIIDVWNHHLLAQEATMPKSLSYSIHGLFIETLLVIPDKCLKLTDPRSVLMIRHLMCFLIFFIGVLSFYLLCNVYFHNWKISLLGSLLLVINARIFSHAFYDTFDISFLSFYIISLLTLILFLEKRTLMHCFLHSLSSAILINIRLIGLILPAYTVLLFLISFAPLSYNSNKRIGIIYLVPYFILLGTLTFLFWPLLWVAPLGNFIQALKQNSGFKEVVTNLYFGHLRNNIDLPWHYGLVWLFITTPIFYIFNFCVGLFFTLKSLLTKNIHQNRYQILFLLSFIVPFILGYHKIYDGYRHLFFVYPLFLIFVLIGSLKIWDFILHQFNKQFHFFHILYLSLFLLTISQTVFWMIANHPYQNVYFNSLAGKNMQDIKSRFDLDFWGLSYKQAFEHILKKDPTLEISISSDCSSCVLDNLNILPANDRKRFAFQPIATATYFLTDYRYHPQEYPYVDSGSIYVGGAKILGIYKLRQQPPQGLK